MVTVTINAPGQSNRRVGGEGSVTIDGLGSTWYGQAKSKHPRGLVIGLGQRAMG